MKKQYTFTWLPTAESRLADLWLSSPNQVAFTNAANAIEQFLATDPLRHGKQVSPRLYELEVSPLIVIFRVSDADRLVEVMDVIELGSLES